MRPFSRRPVLGRLTIVGLLVATVFSSAPVAAFALRSPASRHQMRRHSLPQQLKPQIQGSFKQTVETLTRTRGGSSLAGLTLQPAVIKASVGAVVRLICSCGLGVTAAEFKALDQNAVAVLSRLTFSIFQPALLFANVAKTVAKPAGFGRSLAVLPVFAVVMILIGSVYGKLMSRILRLEPDSDAGRELAICSSFSNSGPLPLLFTDALFRSHADASLVPRSVAYISFYLLTWSPMFWIFGRTLLSGRAGPTSETANDTPWWKRIIADPTFQRVFSPPTMGCVAGAIVGATPFLRNLFLGSGPLVPLFEAIRTLGQAYLPAVLLVLSGSLAHGVKDFEFGMLKRMGALMVSRFVLMPLTALGLLRAGLHFGLIPAQDKLLHFILLLEASMPSAQNSVVILQLDNRPAAAASMARLISLMYIAAILPLALLLSLELEYVKV